MAKIGVVEIIADKIVTTNVAKNPSHLKIRKKNADRILVDKYGRSKKDNPHRASRVIPNGNPMMVSNKINPRSGVPINQIPPVINREKGADKIC